MGGKFKRAIKAIILARVSTEGQGDENHFSIPAQLRSLRDYVANGGRYKELSTKNILAEHSLEESAFRGKRPKFAGIIEYIKTLNEPVALVFDNIDRFARQTKSQILIDVERLRQEGKLELHAVTMNMVLDHTSTANELMVWNILLSVAEGQSNTISEKVKKGVKEKLDRGEYPGYVPTGLKNVTIPVGENRFTKEIQIDEKRSIFVAKLFQLYSTEKYSLQSLTDVMVKAGFTVKAKRARNGNGKLVENGGDRKITKSDILTILRNPFYYGEFYWRDQDTGGRRLYESNGSYPTLISKKLYDRVQKALDSNNTRINGYENNEFKFRGLLECQFCGSTLTPEEMSRSYKNKKSKNANTIYYHCSNGKGIVDPDYYRAKFGTDHSGVHTAKKGKRKGQEIIGCPQRWWKEEEIEAFVLEQFDAMHYDDSVYEALKRMLRKDYEERMEMADVEIKGLKVRYGKNENLISAFTQKFATLTDKRLEEDMMKEYNRLKKDQELLRDEMKNFEEAKEVDTDRTIDTMKLCCDLREHYGNLELKKQRELLFMCFSKIVVCKGSWRINGGKGKRVKTESLYPTFNEPFTTLTLVKINELVAQEEDERQRNKPVTKIEDSKASSFP